MLDLSKPTRILDLGGTASYWKTLGALYGTPNVHITVINFTQSEYDEENLSVRRGDACNLTEYADQSFDIVHSNSVLEHVGGWENMVRMARETLRLAPACFVQTPNYWFPIEPHYKMPFVHWLPEELRIKALLLAKKVPANRSLQLKSVRSIELIARDQMQRLFPDAEIWEEKLFGLTKSLVAIRGGRASPPSLADTYLAHRHQMKAVADPTI
jgi:2-polyprenyl-3-methyl-5-hydroxy-6-metoxy-1,4-benzoquinol methylase